MRKTETYIVELMKTKQYHKVSINFERRLFFHHCSSLCFFIFCEITWVWIAEKHNLKYLSINMIPIALKEIPNSVKFVYSNSECSFNKSPAWINSSRKIFFLIKVLKRTYLTEYPILPSCSQSKRAVNVFDSFIHIIPKIWKLPLLMTSFP